VPRGKVQAESVEVLFAAMGAQIPSEELQEREEGAHSQEQPLLVEEKEEAVAVV